MEKISVRFYALPLLLLSTALFVSCSALDSNSSSKPVTVNMHIGETGTTGLAKSPAATSPSLSSGHITLSEIKFLVEELELESVEEDSMDFEIKNQVISVPLDSSKVSLASYDIADGFYDEFELEIDKMDDDEGDNPVDDPDFSEGDNQYSVVIKGTHNGEDFVFKSDNEFEVEFEFDPPLEINEQTTAASIDIVLDTDRWFVDANANDLDPTNPDHQEQIENNIQRSFGADHEVEEDDDHEEDESADSEDDDATDDDGTDDDSGSEGDS